MLLCDNWFFFYKVVLHFMHPYLISHITTPYELWVPRWTSPRHLLKSNGPWKGTCSSECGRRYIQAIDGLLRKPHPKPCSFEATVQKTYPDSNFSTVIYNRMKIHYKYDTLIRCPYYAHSMVSHCHHTVGDSMVGNSGLDQPEGSWDGFQLHDTWKASNTSSCIKMQS